MRDGTDVTIVSAGQMLHKSLAAAATLAQEGISVEVVDPRTIAPLDAETILASLAKTGRLLIVDETFAPFGLGAEIAALAADRGFDDLDVPIKRLERRPCTDTVQPCPGRGRRTPCRHDCRRGERPFG